jgi:diamine N-acetyltransferase
MIRRATPEDATRLAELAARTFHDTFAPHNRTEDIDAYLSATYSERQQREEIENPDLITLVVEQDDALTGFAQLRLTLPEVEIARFYIDSRWHGRGAAQSLMNEIFAITRELGATRLWLGVWEHNARAIAFYAKCGFRDCGSHPFLLGTDLQTDREMEVRFG